MDRMFLGKCRYCGTASPYRDGQTLVKCTVCGEILVVAEFLNEQIKIKQALEEGRQAEEKLKAAEESKKEAEQRLFQAISALGNIETTQEKQQECLQELLGDQKGNKADLISLTEMAKAIQDNQDHSNDFLESLYQCVIRGQNTADEAMKALRAVGDQLLSSDVNLQSRVAEISKYLKTDSEEKAQMLLKLEAWFQTTHREDMDRLNRIQNACEELIKANEQRDRYIQDLHQEVRITQEAITGFEKRWKENELDKIVRLYHQAEGRQLERQFDKAAEYYRQVIVAGGSDPEVYWRIVLCHYCIEYQVDNEGRRIPSILYPDLTDPEEIPDRTDLQNSFRTEEQKQYYNERLEKIDQILEKYRHLRSKAQFDVFLSVKQKDEGKYTVDCGKAYELYQYIREELGLRVFNSEQTRPPVGQEFEPYILSALLSSKVMIVVGSKAEYMDAQWVRNEWSRFKWLQKYENQNSGGTERVLFCYLVQGMHPGLMPKALAGIQAIEEGVNAKDELTKVLQKAFPGLTTDPVSALIPEEPIEQKIQRWETWLALKKFDEIKKEYNELIQKGQHLDNVRIHLISLCADNRLTGIDQLPEKVVNLPGDSKFILAERAAVSNKDKELISKIKLEFAAETERKKTAQRNRGYASISLLSALTICFILILLYFAEPFEGYQRDTHIEAIVIGGAIILIGLSIWYLIRIVKLSRKKIREVSTGTRLIGLFHTAVSVFAIAGAFSYDWDGWILGRWGFFYKTEAGLNTIQNFEIYALVAALAISAICALITLLFRKGEADSPAEGV